MTRKEYKKPRDFWGNPENAKEWIKRVEYKAKSFEGRNTTVLSIRQLLKDIEPYNKEFNSVLEVGAGNGRLISAISKTYPDKRCCSVDINSGLSKYIHEKYPQIETFVGEVAKLPLEDNSFDLVYTYQVLQHVPCEEIKDALSELQRVAKKEVWLMEGYDAHNEKEKNGIMRTNADGGTYSWFFDKLVKCYSVEDQKNEINLGTRLYKIKVK